MRYRLAAWALSAVVTVSDAAPQQVVPDSVRLEDADTLLIGVAGVDYRIQLPDVDAPENTDNPKLQRDIERTGLDAGVLLTLGRQADAGLQALLDGGAVYRLHFDPLVRDRYGRHPGDLVADDGSTLSLWLVEQGYAIPLPSSDPARQAALDAALAAARAARRGLWGSHGEAFGAWAQPAEK